MTARVIAVGGGDTFRPLIARALLVSPESIVWLPTVENARRALTTARVELVVLGPTVPDEQAMAVAQHMGKEAPSTAVVLVREASVDGAFPRLIRSGIRDVVDLSGGDGELEDALRRALEWSAGVRASQPGPDPGEEGTIVSVFSTKGGTGKTFLACNLAAALSSKTGGRTAIVDLDHDLGDVFAYFNAEPRRPLQDLLELHEGADVHAAVELGTQLPGGVIGYGAPPDPQAEPLPTAAIGKVLRLLQQSFSFVVVDGSAEYSDHVLSAFDVSDVICLVTGLDVIGVRHLSLAMKTLQTLGVPPDRYRIILNRADSKVDLTSADIEKLLGINVDARIPSNSLVPRSINRGRLLWLEAPRSDVARAVGDFADALYRQFSRASTSAMSSRPRGLLKRS